MTRLLAQSLERLKTDHVDLYFLHGMDDISRVDLPEIRAWAEAAKKTARSASSVSARTATWSAASAAPRSWGGSTA